MEVGLGIIVAVCVSVIVLDADGTGVLVWVAVSIGAGKDSEEQSVSTKTNKSNNLVVFIFILINVLCTLYLFEYSTNAKNSISLDFRSLDWTASSEAGTTWMSVREGGGFELKHKSPFLNRQAREGREENLRVLGALRGKFYLFEYSAGAKNTITVNSSSIEWKRCSTFFAT